MVVKAAFYIVTNVFYPQYRRERHPQVNHNNTRVQKCLLPARTPSATHFSLSNLLHLPAIMTSYVQQFVSALGLLCTCPAQLCTGNGDKTHKNNETEPLIEQPTDQVTHCNFCSGYKFT